MAETADNNAEEGPEGCRPEQTTPRTPWVLWVIVCLIVILMVIWSIRKFGTRSSAAESQSTHLHSGGNAAPPPYAAT